jgi:hypothetical protein
VRSGWPAFLAMLRSEADGWRRVYALALLWQKVPVFFKDLLSAVWHR